MSRTLSVTRATQTRAIHVAVLAGLMSIAALPATGQTGARDAPAKDAPAVEFPVFLTTSLRHGLDTTVSPCTDFDRFVNGGWRATTTLPDSFERFDAFTAGYDKTQRLIAVLLDSARHVAATTTDADLRVLGIYYESCLRADSIPKALDRLSMFLALKQDTSRRSRCVRLAMHGLSDALGQAFVRTVLLPETETRVQRLVEDLRAEIRARIAGLAFLTPEAKERTLAALQYMTFKIARPSDTIDHRGLTLSPTEFVANQRAVYQFVWKARMLRKDSVQLPVWMDRQYNPNAHFNPMNNSIEIPTFLFQWPFFADANAEPALTYAAAGTIVGHEIIHGVTFKLGSEGEGSVHRRAQILVQQYSALPPIDGVPINGALTLNENLADLGGLLVAYTAWHRTARPSAVPLIEGFTPDQRFFLHYAHMWRTKATRKWLRGTGASDPHAPGQARINGVLMNIPAFAHVFGCKEGDPMVRSATNRAVIW